MADEKKDDVPMADATASPAVAVATAAPVNENPLMGMKGTVIRQDTQPLECLIQLFIPCIEFDNVYRYAPLPAEKSSRKSLNSTDNGWRPTMTEINNMPKPYNNTEQSDFLTKCLMVCFGCASCRPFQMDFVSNSNPGLSYMHIDRKLALGGCLCCPHQADVSVGGQLVGRVVEDWNCSSVPFYCTRLLEYYFCCRVPYDLQLTQNGQYANRYRINMNFCACGPHCNFCGSSIFCNDMLFDVVPYNTDGTVNDANPVARIQKTYGTRCEPEALVRWLFCAADNYIIEWDENTTAEERALLIASTKLFDYVFFEQKDKNRNTFYNFFQVFDSC